MSTLTSGSDYVAPVDGAPRSARPRSSATLAAAQFDLLDRSAPMPSVRLPRIGRLLAGRQRSASTSPTRLAQRR